MPFLTTGLVTGKLTNTGCIWNKIFVSLRVDLFPFVKASLSESKACIIRPLLHFEQEIYIFTLVLLRNFLSVCMDLKGFKFALHTQTLAIQRKKHFVKTIV